MPVTSLKFTNVGPFDEIEFTFDDNVNILIGPNNSGKSTVLTVLADTTVYPFHFPRKILRENKATFEIHHHMPGQTEARKGVLPIVLSGDKEAYWNQERFNGYVDFQKIIGYASFIPALRRSTDFRSKGPTIHETDTKEQDPELLKRLSLISSDATLVSDEAVIQKIIDLDYASYRRQQPGMRDIIDRIGTIASEITEGFPVVFMGVGEDAEGLFPQFRTPDGDIPLNILSQGTQSLIQWLAHLLIGYAEYYDHPPNLADKPGLLIIDEIDAHLHPSWQRRIIPTLNKYFPNLQIFCSTHSPLMLAGLKAGQVQLLKRDENGNITVSRTEVDIVGWSADEILRSFLDVPEPTDLETVDHIERLEELSNKESLSTAEAKELEKLKRTVRQDLLSSPIASQVEHLTDVLKQAKAEFTAQKKASSSAKDGKQRRKSSSTTKPRKTTR